MFQMVRANQTFINCSFEGNTAVNGGAAQLLANATALFFNTSVEHNTAAAAPKGGGGNGGGIGVGDRAQVRFIGSLLHNNTAELGGGLFVDGNATVNISSTKLVSNSAKKQGGGAHVAGDATANTLNSSLLSNNAQAGAGAFATPESPQLHRRWYGHGPLQCLKHSALSAFCHMAAAAAFL
ncbi:hypothetical protein OEZ85_009351 [Tetradesmus obliquus]|uniref:Right handed beta helix domain-containing protein n=1 Tax=Tetradesmus obliquus TaxID=3088 RepID=A0ABY8U906_TETOB|nr:hypothetical protein OEZ85_009351 [Tetradesmus obliquus]